MVIDEFFERFVDGYLLGDLQSMANITVPQGKTYGGVGYPMVATTLAGMELLGQLLMPDIDPFDPDCGNDYFLNYWNNYFSKNNPTYTGLGRIFRQLARNGISHSFVAKPGILVEKGTNRQMSLDTTRNEIYIDCIVFYKEFEDSYLKLVKPIVDGALGTFLTTKSNMQTRLDNFGSAYIDDSTRLFSALPALHVSTINTTRRAQVPVSPFFLSHGVRASGASGLRGPVPTTTSTTTSTSNSGSSPIPPASVTVPYPNPTPSGTLPSKKNP